MNNQSALDEIKKLETIRIENGYKLGWTYYRAKEKGILNAYFTFKKQESDHSKKKKQDLEDIENLEKVRLRKGYKRGWTYYQAEKKDILDAYHEFLNHEKSKIKRKQILSIELVPRTCWFSNIRSIATNSEWNKIKKSTFSIANYECEICGGKGSKHPVECHEIWDYDDISKIQKLKGLIALCPSCHEVKHIGYANTQGRGDVAKAHLSKVNNWTIEQTNDYVSEQFEVWKERSKFDWKLDISFLRKFGINYQEHERKNILNEKENLINKESTISNHSEKEVFLPTFDNNTVRKDKLSFIANLLYKVKLFFQGSNK